MHATFPLPVAYDHWHAFDEKPEGEMERLTITETGRTGIRVGIHTGTPMPVTVTPTGLSIHR